VVSISFQIEAARKHKKVPAKSLIEQTRAAIGFSSDHEGAVARQLALAVKLCSIW
jgi:hypothetical protein